MGIISVIEGNRTPAYWLAKLPFHPAVKQRTRFFLPRLFAPCALFVTRIAIHRVTRSTWDGAKAESRRSRQYKTCLEAIVGCESRKRVANVGECACRRIERFMIDKSRPSLNGEIADILRPDRPVQLRRCPCFSTLCRRASFLPNALKRGQMNPCCG